MRALSALALLVVVALGASGCTPQGKAYGPVDDAAQAARVAKEELSGSALANGPFATTRQGDTWIVEVSHASESQRPGSVLHRRNRRG